MSRHLARVASAVACVAVFGASGCSRDEQDASSPQTARPVPAAPSTPGTAIHGAPLPSPDALAGVLYRLADPAVPGPQKLPLVEGSSPESGSVYDEFATALVNGGYAPAKFDVRDVAWSDRDPADVVANVNISSPDPRGPRFSFPMEFKPYQGGWQLSARTADVLLAFRGDPPAPAPSPGH